jgi:hypothetical protein
MKLRIESFKWLKINYYIIRPHFYDYIRAHARWLAHLCDIFRAKGKKRVKNYYKYGTKQRVLKIKFFETFMSYCNAGYARQNEIVDPGKMLFFIQHRSCVQNC